MPELTHEPRRNCRRAWLPKKASRRRRVEWDEGRLVCRGEGFASAGMTGTTISGTTTQTSRFIPPAAHKVCGMGVFRYLGSMHQPNRAEGGSPRRIWHPGLPAQPIGGINLLAERANLAPPPPQAKTLKVDDESAGQRLDNYLMRHLKGVPKTHVYRIIRSGEVRVNKGRAGADARVQAGDLVRLPPVRVSERMAEKSQEMAAAALVAPARSFVVLFEDDHLLAIDKPAGVAVHGGSGVSFGVIEQLRMARPQASFLELVHRLDRETSGILLVAKKRSALTHLQDQFRERETGKTYLAVAKAVEALEAGKVGRIVLSRPAVEAGESIGFLPGAMEDKLAPYLRPLYDALSDRLTMKRVGALMAEGLIEIAPVGYMRGRTLNNAFIVIDE
eukprot:gene37576-49189_t